MARYADSAKHPDVARAAADARRAAWVAGREYGKAEAFREAAIHLTDARSIAVQIAGRGNEPGLVGALVGALAEEYHAKADLIDGGTPDATV